MATTWISLHLHPHTHPLLYITKPKLAYTSLATHNNLAPPLSLSTSHSVQSKPQIWRLYAGPEEALTSETAPVESAQQMVAATDDPTSNIISVLLFIAFVVLSILSIGVIYLGVTDFLQKREKEKFEKEEAAKKKGGKKGKVRGRTGPRGFGQTINEDDDL